MNGNAQAQSTAQFNLASLLQQAPYKNLLRPEQITAQQFPFLTEQELTSYPAGVKNLWNAVAQKPADDPQHQQALAKLQQLTRNILQKYQHYKGQVQQRQPQNGQQQQQPDGQQRPGSQGQQQGQQPQGMQQAQTQPQQNQQQQSSQQPQPQQVPPQQQPQQVPPQQQQQQSQAQQQQQVQSQMPPQQPQAPPHQQPPAQPIAQPMMNQQLQPNPTQSQHQNAFNPSMGPAPDTIQWEAPITLHGQDAENYKIEAQKRYDSAVLQQRIGREQIQKIDQYLQLHKAKGSDISEDVVQTRAKHEKNVADAHKFIENLLAIQRSNRTAAAQAAGRPGDGMNGQPGQQQLPNGIGGMQNRQQPSTGPTNPMIEAARQQQQLPRPGSPAIPGQPGQPQLPMPSQLTQQATANANNPANPMSNLQPPSLARPQLNPTQPQQHPHPQGSNLAPTTIAPPSLANNHSPAPLSQQAAIAASQRSYSNLALPSTLSAAGLMSTSGSGSRPDLDKSNNRNGNWPPPNKSWVPTPPAPVGMGSARPTLAGVGNGPAGVMGQPAITKQPTFMLQGSGEHVLSTKKLDELVRQVTGGSGNGLHPEVEESVLQLADEFIDNVITSACRLAKLRGSSTLEVRDLQLVLERQYNIRVPGYATDEIRTVKKIAPATGWLQKMNAVQAAKVMGGKTDI